MSTLMLLSWFTAVIVITLKYEALKKKMLSRPLSAKTWVGRSDFFKTFFFFFFYFLFGLTFLSFECFNTFLSLKKQ